MRLFLSALLATLPFTASAVVTVDFRESAPKDSFTITNASGCDLSAVTVRIDLSTAPSGLIFDVTGEGAGVEVFQPFEAVRGDFAPKADVRDGDQVIDLELASLADGDSIRFTIDVDDTLENGALGQIRVAGSEMAGATVELSSGNYSETAVFDTNARTAVSSAGC